MKYKMVSGGTMFIDNNKLEKKVRGEDFFCKRETGEITSGRQKRFKSAGVRGLYGDPTNREIVNENSDYSFRNKVKSILL